MAASAAAAPVAAPASKPNVVLIVVDALRPDHLSAYGYGRLTSPRLDALAARGALFTRAFAQANWTVPALASLMTSLYPSAHGAVVPPRDRAWAEKLARGEPYEPGPGERLDPAYETLASRLSADGAYAGAIVSGGFCRSAFGFARGFAEYHDDGRPFGELEPEASRWLEKNRQRRFFLYLHVSDVHDPYAHGQPYDSLWDHAYRGTLDGSRATLDALRRGERTAGPRDVEHLRALYDSGISYTDEHLGRFLARLDELGLSTRTLVVVTADHGEALGEEGLFGHGRSSGEEQLRVPLIVAGPGVPAGLRVEAPARAIDVLPTVLALSGAPAPAGVQGRSLAPLLAGQALPGVDAISEAFDIYARPAAPGTLVLRRGDWRLIEPLGGGKPRLFAADQARDVAAQNPPVVAELRAGLAAWRAAQPRPRRSPRAGPALDADAIDALRRAGYLERAR